MGFNASLQMKRLAFIPHRVTNLSSSSLRKPPQILLFSFVTLIHHPYATITAAMGDDSGMDALHILEFSFNFNRLSKSVFIAAVTPTQILIQLS
ncbi:hypothetical protein HanPSC8_Chr07g0305971 [Helianthus annuus]|nr:hypothetical protein HanPSC8_Chr07g0305971 [Helianthus annuus]